MLLGQHPFSLNTITLEGADSMQLVGPDGKHRNYQDGTPLVDIAPDYQATYDTPIALGVLNGREVPLQWYLRKGIKFVSLI